MSNRERFEQECRLAAIEKVGQLSSGLIKDLMGDKVCFPFYTNSECFDKLIYDRKSKKWSVEYKYISSGEVEPKTYSFDL